MYLPSNTSLLRVLNGFKSRKVPFEAIQGEVILFGKEQPLGDVLRTGLAPPDLRGGVWL